MGLNAPGVPMSLPALSLVAEPLADTFHRDGFLVLRGAVETDLIDGLVDKLAWLVARRTQERWSSLFSVSLARHLATHPEVRRDLIAQARVPAWLTHFILQDGIVDPVVRVYGATPKLGRRIELDLTPPMTPALMKPWHQDYFYSRGSGRTLLAYVPLHDCGLREGGLQVMPGSHRMGAVAHDRLVLGQRHVPSGIEDREIRQVPLSKGDLVLMHTLLLRQDGLNMSPAARVGLTARFVPEGARVAKCMDGVVDIP